MTFRGFSKCICIVQNQVLHIYCFTLIHMQCVEKQRHYFANKSPHSQDYGLPSGLVHLWELDCKEGAAPKNWCLQTVVPEKTPESTLESKEIKPVNLKGNQSWILIGRNNVEAESPVFWSSDAPTPVFLPGESQGRGSLGAAVYGVAQGRTWLKQLSSSSRC